MVVAGDAFPVSNELPRGTLEPRMDLIAKRQTGPVVSHRDITPGTMRNKETPRPRALLLECEDI